MISLHEAEVQNAVGPCGTAVTQEQVAFLKRYTQNIVLMQDADKAGVKSMMKAIDLFLTMDFKVEVVELPGNMDPDEFVRHKRAAA